jgi:hypothetical protein
MWLGRERYQIKMRSGDANLARRTPMIRKNLASKAIVTRSALVVASVLLTATLYTSSASAAAQSVSASAEFGAQHPLRVADAVTKPKTTKKMKKTGVPHKVQRGPGKTWLNPQPEPPKPSSKVGKGKTWLNPQPEPPRPDTHATQPR